MLFGAICTGTMLGLSSPLIPSIEHDNSTAIKIGRAEKSWIGVSFSLSHSNRRSYVHESGNITHEDGVFIKLRCLQ